MVFFFKLTDFVYYTKYVFILIDFFCFQDITFGTYPITIDGYYTTESPELVYRCGNNIHAESVLLVLSRDELFPSRE